MTTRFRTLALLLGAFVAACGESSSDEPPLELAVGVVEIIQGEDQVDTVGQQLPLAIRIVVLDTTSAEVAGSLEPSSMPPAPVPGQLVNFVVTSGGGSVFAGAALTDSLGQAQELWTLGPLAGDQCLEARAVDQETGDPITYAEVCATALPGPLATAGFTIDSARVYGDTTFLVPAFARDAFNNPLPLPEIANPDSGVTLTPEGESYRVAFTRSGLTRLAVGGDTLYLYAFTPRGWYQWVRHRGDTTWFERGKFRLVPITAPAVSCWNNDGPYPANRLRRFAADSLFLVKTIVGQSPDTIYNDFMSGNDDHKLCSRVEDGFTNPLRPATDPYFVDMQGFGFLSGVPDRRLFSAEDQIAPWVFVNVDLAWGTDTLWLNTP